MSSRHPRQAQRAPRPEAAKTAEGDTNHIPGAKGYKKIYITELPIIDLNSGPNISHIREAIIQYCQRELGSIAGIFIEGIYSPPATASYNVEEIKADSTGLKKEEASARIKRAESDNDKYEKDKIKLHGILSGMTTREVDERVQAHRDSLRKAQSTSNFGSLSMTPTTLTTTTMSRITSPAAELQCPLTLWKHIVHVTTTRTIANTTVDQNDLSINFANIRQRSSESVADFKRRMQNLMDSFDAIKLDRPKHEMIAMRFLHGLDDSRYGSLKVWLGNEAANGRDLYPSNLDGAASQATRWLSTNIKPVSVFPPSPSVNTFITGKSGPPKREKDLQNRRSSQGPYNPTMTPATSAAGRAIRWTSVSSFPLPKRPQWRPQRLLEPSQNRHFHQSLAPCSSNRSTTLIQSSHRTNSIFIPTALNYAARPCSADDHLDSKAPTSYLTQAQMAA